MQPLKYHEGQLSIQREAKTTIIAERLSRWYGPIAEFSTIADLFLLATQNKKGVLEFTVLSGTAPLVKVHSLSSGVQIVFPMDLKEKFPSPIPCGGLAINLSQARRVRLNGILSSQSSHITLDSSETFTLCRKYMAPSISVESQISSGPQTRDPIKINDPRLAKLLAKTETAFLASLSPTGMPDVAHRGGTPGFIKLNASSSELTWTEYVGDGIFKSAGNIRATGVFTLLVTDIDGGDGVELVGRGEYQNIRTDRHQRLDALVQLNEPYPVQGRMVGTLESAFWLQGVHLPRKPTTRIGRYTSHSTVDDQAPQ